MYFLRKEPYPYTIPEIKKTDGTVIPARELTTDDRALYQHNDLPRFYRDSYPEPSNTGTHVFTTDKMDVILAHRNSLFDYCGEWFDVYDENGIVPIQDGEGAH